MGRHRPGHPEGPGEFPGRRQGEPLVDLGLEMTPAATGLFLVCRNFVPRIMDSEHTADCRFEPVQLE